MREVEKRVLALPVELRAKEGSTGTLYGYAARYMSHSHNLGGFIEQIAPGAFDRALAEKQDVLARAEHDSALLLGRTSSGTVRLMSDAQGLRYEVDLPDTQAGRDYAVLTGRGDVRGSSFAFMLGPAENAQEWSVLPDGTPLRTLTDLDLIDVAPTANPAYAATSVSARALEQAQEVAKPADIAPEQRKSLALLRFLAQRKSEKRAAPLEEQIEAVWLALYELLGYPWMEDGGCWEIEATYPDSVIVERAPGQYEQYPLSIDAANNVTLGAPVAVEATWSPIEAPAVPDDQAARGVPNSVNELRLRLSKA